MGVTGPKGLCLCHWRVTWGKWPCPSAAVLSQSTPAAAASSACCARAPGAALWRGPRKPPARLQKQCSPPGFLRAGRSSPCSPCMSHPVLPQRASSPSLPRLERLILSTRSDLAQHVGVGAEITWFAFPSVSPTDCGSLQGAGI